MNRLPGWLAVLLVGAACSSSTGPQNGGPSQSCTTSATRACVTIRDFSFSPASVSITVGSTVEWTNNGPSAHSTTSDGTWNSGTLSGPTGGDQYGGGLAGGSFQFRFNVAGTYQYFCSVHPPSQPQYAGFTGTITVTQ